MEAFSPPMNTPILRGLAALALLCLLPRASALTITQTAELAYAHTIDGRTSAYGGQFLTLAPFDPSLGALTSVQYSITRTIDAWASETNAWGDGSTLSWTPAISAQSIVVINGNGSVTATVGIRDSASGPLVQLAPFAHANFATQFTHTEVGAFTLPDDLTIFLGPTLRLNSQTSVQSASYFGQAAFQATGNITFVYQYAVSDSGDTSLLAFGCAGLLVIARLRFRLVQGNHGKTAVPTLNV